MTALALTERQPNTLGVVERINEFAATLRANGYAIASSDVSDTISVLANFGEFPKQTELQQILQALFCKSVKETDRFSEIFDAYWLGQTGRKRTLMRETSSVASAIVEKNQQESVISKPPRGLAAYFEWRASNNDEFAAEEPGEASPVSIGGAAGGASLRARDFGSVSDPNEAEALLSLTDKIAREMRARKSRRYRRSSNGQLIDLRRSMRKSMKTGGLPLRLFRKKRQRPPVSLVVFVDVSGSMDSYSLFFTRFMATLTRGIRNTHAFIFHTQLVRVTGMFREAKADVLLDKMSLIGQGWSGGTQLGESLRRFNRHNGPAMRRSRTIALLMSDGYDAGEPEILSNELKTLKKHCRKLIWLNPLLGRESYSATSQGAVSLSKHADLIAAAHNLSSLEKAATVFRDV